MQEENPTEKKARHCYGAVTERKNGKKVTLELNCLGDCAKGKCEKRSRTDHHGTTVTWCSCDDEPGGCNIYIEKKHNGEERFDCFTLGCDDADTECRPVKRASSEVGGEEVTVWVCDCVKKN